jgi:serine O-acetyltransferase
VKDPDFKKLSESLAKAYRHEAPESLGSAAKEAGKPARTPALPSRDTVDRIRKLFFQVLFPGVFCEEGLSGKLRSRTRKRLGLLHRHLGRVILGLCAEGIEKKQATEIARKVLEGIPVIRENLRTDVSAALQNDPAAQSFDEVLLAYPFVEAIATHRVAHELYKAGVPILPRMMSEQAHRGTGIDIHPGATIGRHFFIDHGTGTVIGETAVIGERVTLYQGVTIGAKNPKNSETHNQRGVKRHPTLKDGVTVYAGATILGGDTVIGKGCVVGGNVWLTHGLPDGAKVLAAQAENRVIAADGETRL